MVGRLGTKADVLMTESTLSRILETIDSMLIEKPLAGVLLSGECFRDDVGEYVLIRGIDDNGTAGMCVGSAEGGTEPSEDDLHLFRKNVGRGILMKADVYSHQFSLYKVGDEVAGATILFVERVTPRWHACCASPLR